MHASTIVSALALAAPAIAHPGMGKMMKDIQERAHMIPRQEAEARPNGGLMGDLVEGITTPVGQTIADILTGKISGQVDGIPEEGAFAKRQDDPCAVWGDVSNTLTGLFLGPSGRCNDNARAAVRMGFHDAFSGGADGSLIMDFGEENFPHNNGLQQIRDVLRSVQAQHNVGFADLVQFAHNHATVTCPLGPRIRTFVGRPDATQSNAADSQLPDANDSADNLIALFAAQGFTVTDLAALLGAHTTGRAFHQFTDTPAGTAFDSTPGVWDVEVYNETINGFSDSRFRSLPSDIAIATSAQGQAAWNSFIGRQGRWNALYANAYIRMSQLGVPNNNALTECTAVLPAARTTFSFAPGEFILEK